MLEDYLQTIQKEEHVRISQKRWKTIQENLLSSDPG